MFPSIVLNSEITPYSNLVDTIHCPLFFFSMSPTTVVGSKFYQYVVESEQEYLSLCTFVTFLHNVNL